MLRAFATATSIEKIVAADAARGKRSVQMYILDNEPMLWNSTHRDVHPEPVTYDELLDRTVRYASAIRAARASRGKTGALDPLIRRVLTWQESGMRVILAARAHTQVERLVTLLRHRDVKVKALLGAFDPALLDAAEPSARGAALVVVGSLARGVVAPAEALALVTEEEIFGARARRQSRRKGGEAGSRPFLDDLRALEVGDFVVHVDHGIGKYLGRQAILQEDPALLPSDLHFVLV